MKNLKTFLSGVRPFLLFAATYNHSPGSPSLLKFIFKTPLYRTIREVALEMFKVLTTNDLNYNTLIELLQMDDFGKNKIKVIIELVGIKTTIGDSSTFTLNYTFEIKPRVYKQDRLSLRAQYNFLKSFVNSVKKQNPNSSFKADEMVKFTSVAVKVTTTGSNKMIPFSWSPKDGMSL